MASWSKTWGFECSFLTFGIPVEVGVLPKAACPGEPPGAARSCRVLGLGRAQSCVLGGCWGTSEHCKQALDCPVNPLLLGWNVVFPDELV